MSKPTASPKTMSQYVWHVLNQLVFAIWTLQLMRAAGPMMFGPMVGAPPQIPLI